MQMILFSIYSSWQQTKSWEGPQMLDPAIPTMILNEDMWEKATSSTYSTDSCLKFK